MKYSFLLVKRFHFMQNVFASNRWAFVSMLVVILFAGFSRLWDAENLAYFRYDQARISQLALEIARGDAFHWTGVDNSVGLPTSPITVWFYAVLFFLRNDPQFVTFMVALFNVLGVFALWWIGHRYFGFWVGLFAGLTLAVNPWLINYSRAIWEPRVLIPFLTIAMAIGFRGYIDNKTWAQLIFLPCLLLAIQFHYAAFFLFPIYFIVLWLGRANIQWRSLLISWVLGLLVIAPFVYGISINQGNTSNSFETIIGILSDGIRFRYDAIEQTIDLITGLGSETLLGNQASTFLNTIAPRSELLWQSLLLLVAISLVFVWRIKWRKYAILLIFWAFCILLVQTPIWTGRGVFLHYHLGAMPAFALLIGISIQSILDGLEKFPYAKGLKFVLISAFIAFFSSQALWMWQLYRFSDTVFAYDSVTGQTQTPLHHIMNVRAELADYDDVIILGANPHESNYYVWQTLLYDTATCVRDLLINDGIVDILPRGPYAVLVAPLNPINANYEVPPRYQNESPIVMPLREGEDPYIIYSFDEAPVWTETDIVSIDVNSFVNGLRLSGYYLSDEWLQLRWEIPSNGGETYQFFAHFLDANGERLGQRDAPFYVGQHWCEGDTIVTTTQISLPPETRMLRIGLYQFKDSGGTQNLAVADDSGNPMANWIDIPLERD